MYLVNKYILKNLFKNFFVYTFLFLFIALLTRVVHYSEILTEDGGSIKDFLFILLLIQPKLISVLTPFTATLSAFMTFNNLIKSNEHIAIYNARVSQTGILKPLIYFCLPLFIFVIFNSSIIVPSSYRKMQKIQNNLAVQLSKNIIKPEEFLHQKDVTFFIHDVTNEGLSKGIVIFDGRTENKMILAASEGKIYFNGGIFGIKGSQIYLYKKTELAKDGVRANLKIYDFSVMLKDSLSFNSYIEFENNKNLVKALRMNKAARKEFLQRFGMPFFIILLPLTMTIILIYYFNFARSRASYQKMLFALFIILYVTVSGFGFFEFFIGKYNKLSLYFINILLIFTFILFILRARFLVKLFK